MLRLVQRRQSAGGDGPRHLRREPAVENSITRHTARESSLASLLYSWSNPREVRRCTHEFRGKLLVTMNQAPSRRTRDRKTPNSKLHLVLHWLSRSLRGPIDSHKWLADVLVSPQALQKPRPSSTSTTAAFGLWDIVSATPLGQTEADLVTTQLLLLNNASVFNIGLAESARAGTSKENSRSSRQPSSTKSNEPHVFNEAIGI